MTGGAWASVKIEPFVPQECSSRPQFVMVLNGEPLANGRLDFYRGFNVDTSHTHPVLSLSTTGVGVAIPPKLSGDYTVFATFDGVKSTIFNESARTILYLQVRHKPAPSTISVDMTEAVQQVRRADADFEQQLDTAEKTSTAERVSSFRGGVFDPSRAHVSSARVSILKRISGVWTTSLRTVSDVDGEFSGQLEDGRYVAIVSAPGFRIAIVPFEVTSGAVGSLQVMLDVGAATE
jgi:hypothetical protein